MASVKFRAIDILVKAYTGRTTPALSCYSKMQKAVETLEKCGMHIIEKRSAQSQDEERSDTDPSTREKGSMTP